MGDPPVEGEQRGREIRREGRTWGDIEERAEKVENGKELGKHAIYVDRNAGHLVVCGVRDSTTQTFS